MMTHKDIATTKMLKTAVAIIIGIQTYRILSRKIPNQMKKPTGTVIVHTSIVVMNCVLSVHNIVAWS